MAAAATPSVSTVAVPVVACPSDGQLGPQPAPTDLPAAPRVAQPLAERLALYASEEGPDVLAPRGWRCLGLSGSDGSVLIVTPSDVDPQLYGRERDAALGPAVVASLNLGATSGRIAVWRAIGRYFQSFDKIVDRQMWDELGLDELPDAPYPTDRILAHGPRQVELETPAGADGEGTAGFLGKADLPTRAFRRLLGSGDEAALLSVDVRLADDQVDLADAIIGAMRKNP